MEKFDVLFIGSGQAAWNAALPLALGGKAVGIIEEGKVAGTCTNYGCDAKFVLDAPIKALEELKRYEEVALSPVEVSVDWAKLMRHKHNVIDPLASQVQGLLERVGVRFIFGHAEFTDSKTVAVNKDLYTAEKFVVATGQRPAQLDIPGKEFLKTSTAFLDLPELPETITFIGAGYVSMELASIAAASGAKVSIVEFGSQALAGFDEEYTGKLVEKMKQEGIQFFFNQGVTAVNQIDEKIVEVKTDKDQAIQSNYVVDATGRIPNVENVGLDKACVEYDRNGIIVDEWLQTTQKNIYASGDVIHKSVPKLTPTAAFEARYIANLFLGKSTEKIEYPLIATAVFTLPRIAEVGVSTKEAALDSEKYTIKTIELGNSWDYKGMNEKEASMKLVFDKQGLLVGATNYSNEAPETINGLITIMQNKLTPEEMQNVLTVFPSLDYNLPLYLGRGF
ncbi:NAD(P)/FAD-dependent oxidoreductase [Enterococcus devriesei]|uniref:dihydrolipoyl dehydrogenase family protein n=1 Tax=Enterococcus devriesei TaxID=319970 RepID=UPI001C107572|nr:NAD(P)/FAD-dependent oxidoreductase [Enterococcus devriesei]MBU5366098.1 NAD(P)/FAD-dependent oxidoreductase [Enterococcus devriesei]MDT2821790.1 NAD(P)/FAD-dependent oxidoreductase [Enterococcus devriesei]